MQIKSAAQGRWDEIFRHFGVGPFPARHGPCPMCGGSDRFRYDDREGNGTFYCNQCGPGDGIDLVSRLKGLSLGEVQKEIARLLGAALRRIGVDRAVEDVSHLKKVWSGVHAPVSGGPVETYIKKRTGITQLPKRLYEHDRLWHPEAEQYFPGMVTKIALGGRAVNLHLTYLTPDGCAAPVTVRKRVLKGKLPPGCAIPIDEPGPVLGIAEGIETSLSARQMFDVPVWAAVNANCLAQFEPPNGIERLIIFSDNDKNYHGQAKAFALAHRMVVRNQFDVEIKIPRLADFNDDHCDSLSF